MKLIILDRDGVINHDSDAYIKSPAEWLPIEGSLAAISRLNQAGWKVVVASNQSGVGRGLFSAHTLTQIHLHMRAQLASVGARIDALFFCPHGPDDGCDCRKPKTGMLRDIARRFDISLHGVPLVGDSLRDLQAASAMGCAPWLVLSGKGQQTLANQACAPLPADTQVRANLAAVVDSLLETPT